MDTKGDRNALSITVFCYTFLMSDHDTNNAIDMQLSSGQLTRVELNEKVEKDYFYIPVITYVEEGAYDEDWYSLRYSEEKDTPRPLLTYASKVPTSSTLKQAVAQDLEKDFGYSRGFTISDIVNLDVERDKQGNTLTRVLINLTVDEKFDTAQISPAHLKPQWFYQGEADINYAWRDTLNFFFRERSLRDELLEAYTPFVRKGLPSPFTIKATDNKESKRVLRLDAVYHEAMELLKEPLKEDDKIKIEIAEATVFYDAGFTGTSILDKIANDWLIGVRQKAEKIHRQDLVDEIQLKIDKINQYLSFLSR